MAAGNIFAGILLLVYGFFLVKSIPGKRQGWFFNTATYKNSPEIFYAALVNDGLATLIYFWLTFVARSTIVGRSTILWMAHLAFSALILGEFVNDEGGHYGCFARPCLLLLGLYWYYIAIGPGVSLSEIFETIGEILDS